MVNKSLSPDDHQSKQRLFTSMGADILFSNPDPGNAIKNRMIRSMSIKRLIRGDNRKFHQNCLSQNLNAQFRRVYAL